MSREVLCASLSSFCQKHEITFGFLKFMIVILMLVFAAKRASILWIELWLDPTKMLRSSKIICYIF